MGAAQALGFITLMADMGVQVKATVHTDASAAIGIARRAGLGKLRHLNVRYLWLQHELHSPELTLHKVHGLSNPADLVTKHLGQHLACKHLEILDIRVEGGRAASAPIFEERCGALALAEAVGADETSAPPLQRERRLRGCGEYSHGRQSGGKRSGRCHSGVQRKWRGWRGRHCPRSV